MYMELELSPPTGARAERTALLLPPLSLPSPVTTLAAVLAFRPPRLLLLPTSTTGASVDALTAAA
eukprot:66523-Pleurochrysis_carterae.AAC.3